MAFPTSLTSAEDGVTTVSAAHLNNLEAKIGIDNSAVTTSHDYKLSGVTGTEKAVSDAAIIDEDDMASDSATKVPTQQSVKAYVDNNAPASTSEGTANILKNGNFINNSTNGYGGTPDDWTSSSSNPVQGGFPTFTKAELISILGISDGDIEGLWNLNEASGDAVDLSANGYTLTDNNTVATSSDGLMGNARDIEKDNSEYFAGTTANCGINGNSTYFIWVKPEGGGTSNGQLWQILGSTAGKKDFILGNTGNMNFRCAGFTPSNMVTNISLESGKWSFICIVQNGNTSVDIYVNGVKQTFAVSSGTQTAYSGTVTTRLGFDGSADYYDGLVQNFGILSVALTEAQVKRLWAYTSYRGQKIRRATTDALLYQDLDEDLVARLRGKTITLRASVYATSTNHRIYIYDGTDTTADSPSSANAWEDLSVTATIGANATTIRLGLEADTTDGTMWIKEVGLYQGSVALPYIHSANDWSRFPRLLRMSIPAVFHGKPYAYEEGRWFAWQPVYTAGGSMTYTSVTTTEARYMFTGSSCYVKINVVGTTGGSASSWIFVSYPIFYGGGQQNDTSNAAAFIYDGADLLGLLRANVSGLQFLKQSLAAYNIGAEKYLRAAFFYEI